MALGCPLGYWHSNLFRLCLSFVCVHVLGFPPPLSSGPFKSRPTLASNQHPSIHPQRMDPSERGSDQCPRGADGSHSLCSKLNSIRVFNALHTWTKLIWEASPPIAPCILLMLVLHQTKLLALTRHGLSHHLECLLQPSSASGSLES